MSSVLAAAAESSSPEFSKDIAPLLTKYCTGCHNDSDREGKLSLASYESLLKGGEKGSVVTPGQPELSRLVRVITGQAEPKMPPDGEKAPQPAEIEILKQWIAAGAKDPAGGSAQVALVTPQIKLLAPPKRAIHAVALSPDGQSLAVALHGEVEVLSAANRKLLYKLEGIPGSVNGVAFSAEGQSIVAAAGEPGLVGEARLFRVADGSLVRIFRGHSDSLYCAALSPNGAILATGGYDNAIKLWEVASGKELRSLDGHNGAVFELAFRPDGRVLASASGDRTVKLWDVATGQRLDTLKESQKELYSLAFSPNGQRLAAAGVDNRIRVWSITPDAKEGTNPLRVTKFAHETPILRLAWSANGTTLATSGEDRLVKIWNAETMTIRQTLPRQSDWASGLSLSASGDQVVVGRIDGSLAVFDIEQSSREREQPLLALPEVPPEVDYGPQPATGELPVATEAEPNDAPPQATAISTPGRATGKIAAALAAANSTGAGPLYDADLFRFAAKAGEQWIIETKAAQAKSPLDTKIEILDHTGKPVPRLLLRAVRDTVIEFRGMNSEQRGVRLANWEEMLLNEYVYLSGDVIKLFQQRRGPDADGQFYPENGNRFAFFETTSRAHNLGEPGYIVVPYPVGTELPNNGLPVFTLNYENDDDSFRKLGKDSRLTFVAPVDGTYFVRVSDVRGFSGDDFAYELTIRRPQPDFQVALNAGKELTVNAGSGKPFTVKAERIDNYMGPIRVEVAGVPPGFQITSPIVIAAGLYEANGVVNALADAVQPTEQQLKELRIGATAMLCGVEHSKEVAAGGLGQLKLADKSKVIVHLEPSVESAAAPAPDSEHARTLVLRPGGTVTCKLRVERNDFKERIAFDVANLPHGVIVDDIGLSGVLIPEQQTERTIFLRAEPWVPEQSRHFFATAQVDGNQVSLPLILHVRNSP